jgi:hypothetical protein
LLPALVLPSLFSGRRTQHDPAPFWFGRARLFVSANHREARRLGTLQRIRAANGSAGKG